MKLYATITSERATKGQGGNKYLKIIIRNEQQHCIGYVTFKPDNTCDISIIKDIKTELEQVEWIGTDDDTKAKKEKGENLCASGHKQDADGKCPCVNANAY